MSGNTFGNIFKVTTFGESHGHALGCIIDGCPPNLEIDESDIQIELDRRKPGQSDVTTQRKEDDTVQILSGVFEGKTLGTPISLLIFNKDQQSKDYSNKLNEGFNSVPWVAPENIPQGLPGHSAYVITPWAAQDIIKKQDSIGWWPNDAIMCKQLCEWLYVYKPFFTKTQGIKSTTSL